VSEPLRDRWLWWLFLLLGVVVIYKIVTMDVTKVSRVEVNTTVVGAAKAKLHDKE
jgi:hypothetical protein